jgi:hypothetical protein
MDTSLISKEYNAPQTRCFQSVFKSLYHVACARLETTGLRRLLKQRMQGSLQAIGIETTSLYTAALLVATGRMPQIAQGCVSILDP